MTDDLAPRRAATSERAVLRPAIRRGKATGRFNELAAQFAAEALADLLQESTLFVMRKPPLKGMAQTQGDAEREKQSG